MNIKQALKRKNVLVENIKKEYSRLESYNSVEVGNIRPYSPTECLANYVRLTNELIDLKTSIHIANVSIYSKIFRLSELKSMVKYLKAMNCTDGNSTERWGSNVAKIMNAEIGIVKRDTIVFELEEEINKIQDELDYHNQVTELVIQKFDSPDDYFLDEDNILGFKDKINTTSDESDKDDLPF